MGAIIRFPEKKSKTTKRRLEDFFLERLPDHEQHCNASDMRFTCATCGHVSRFSFSGVVFRECSFYCSSCGVGYKLDNPLFGRKRNTRSQ